MCNRKGMIADIFAINLVSKVGMSRSTFMLPEEELDTIAEQYHFEDGRVVNAGKNIMVPYKLGSEYASGGAGGISTVDDYIKFLEALRTHKLLKPETLQLMMTDRLTERQKRTYWRRENHGYGLGVRCPKGDEKYVDFGWGGAACAFLAVDMENKISLYFGAHVLSSPAQDLRSVLYRFVRAELIDHSGVDDLYKDLNGLQGFKLPY